MKFTDLIKEEEKTKEGLLWQALKPAILESWSGSQKYKYGRIKFATDVVKDNLRRLDDYVPFVLWFKKSTYDKLLKTQKSTKPSKTKGA